MRSSFRTCRGIRRAPPRATRLSAPPPATCEEREPEGRGKLLLREPGPLAHRLHVDLRRDVQPETADTLALLVPDRLLQSPLDACKLLVHPAFSKIALSIRTDRKSTRLNSSHGYIS